MLPDLSSCLMLVVSLLCTILLNIIFSCLIASITTLAFELWLLNNHFMDEIRRRDNDMDDEN
jgi:hypothetical protein